MENGESGWKGSFLMAYAKLKAGELSEDQLLELRALIDDNLADQKPDDNQQIAAAEPDSDQPDDAGYIETKYIPRKQADGTVKLYGPYNYRVRMVDGRKRRKYLGKAKSDV